eukprot:CAMPEP_0173404262 /NCGR_PEP_ID=MMETSP1356-20130122/58925_1 /TAXON_ID=77927 ORGANISM="Hemiselmis virescens, Strain PCC157" /NCGR_SAMPLE_ID=MMETSP1356 /ASSEMBLY_ACC=CAM_ASM_000847 /LENGTH=318 /DNA_ID=CAMNT_0014364909 /DNA_START=126 /DNA_END=1079 /DNA_ORIENTATION=-
MTRGAALLVALGLLAVPTQCFQGIGGLNLPQGALESPLSRCWFVCPAVGTTRCATPPASTLVRGRQMAARGVSALQMKGEVKIRDRVTVHYEGRLDSGELVDSSRERGKPFTFTVGLAETLIGFEQLTLGMKVGEARQGRVEAEQAYGARREDLVVLVSEESVPGVKMVVGAEISLPNGVVAPVTDVSPDGSFTIDMNHKLAGQAISYDIEVLDIAAPKTKSSSGSSLLPLSPERLDKDIARLSAESKKCLLMHATEPAFKGKTANGYEWDTKERGIYSVALGGLPVFTSRDKFDHDTGMMSFTAPIDPDHIIIRIDT